MFLARALAQSSQIILLDEPFTGVDVKTEDSIINLMREARDENCSILVSTHNLGSVPEFCDHVVMRLFGCLVFVCLPGCSVVCLSFRMKVGYPAFVSFGCVVV